MNFLLPKLTIIRDRAYLDWLHTEPCIVLGIRSDSVEPAHIGTLGKGIKSSDDEVLPLSHCLHSRGHNAGEISMFREKLPDYVLREALRAYAREQYRQYLQSSASETAPAQDSNAGEANEVSQSTSRLSGSLAGTT